MTAPSSYTPPGLTATTVSAIERDMARGAAWMVLLKLTERGIGLLSTIIVARLLVPADFGLLAMAMSLIAMLDLIWSFQFDVALIRYRDIDRRYYDTAWTFNALFALGCAVLLVLLASPAARFYGEPRLAPVMIVLALATAVGGLENVGIVEFRKQMRFDKDFRFNITRKLAGFVVVVASAVALRNYWALVLGTLAIRLTGVMASYLYHPYRPRPSLAARAELFDFTKWLQINNVLYFVKDRGADFLIGRFAGSHALGLYAIAWEIAHLPTTELIAPINRAVYAGYARIADDFAVLQERFLRVLSVIALVALPAGVTISLTAEALVHVLFGPQWSGSAPIVRVLALAAVATSMQSNTAAAYLAIGKPRVLSTLAALHAAILLPALGVGIARAGSRGAAWAVLGTAMVMLPVNYGMLFRNLKLSPRIVLRATWRPVVAAPAMAGTILVVERASYGLPDLAGHLVPLVVSVGSGLVVYAAIVWLLARLVGADDGAEATIARLVARRIAGWTPTTWLSPGRRNVS